MIEQLDRLGLYLNQPEPAILCIQCKFALKADGDRVSRHLGEQHGISKLAYRGLGLFIQSLRLPDPKTLPVRSDGSSPYPHLRIQQGVACKHCGCGFSESHWLQDHILDRLSFQAWIISHIERSWTVHLYCGQPQGPHTPVNIYQAPEVFAKELFTISATDLALIMNWMRRTGWEETFCNTQRDLIVAIDEALISSQEDEHKLTRIIAALDCLFKCSNDTIKHTDISLRRWLCGIYPNQPYKQPFELVVKPGIERRYCQLLKKCLCFWF
ncbi:hypothetical protein DER46DRAFT_630878 [Fusarium sp. MPI-SDFR-AT-0072]|nr:hypothetical protein DER46DRAFT_630878 [Fusarium sp. MPI-SDFR-AT-0072]